MAGPNLKNPLLAGVVLTVLAVVVVFNMKTFVFKSDDSLMTARPGRDPRPPADLATIVENVLNDSDLLSVAIAAPETMLEGMTRDPFLFGSEPVAAKAPKPKPRSKRTKPRTTGSLACTAVILDGKTPTRSSAAASTASVASSRATGSWPSIRTAFASSTGRAANASWPCGPRAKNRISRSHSTPDKTPRLHIATSRKKPNTRGRSDELE
jgi:hypothetical protein